MTNYPITKALLVGFNTSQKKEVYAFFGNLDLSYDLEDIADLTAICDFSPFNLSTITLVNTTCFKTNLKDALTTIEQLRDINSIILVETDATSALLYEHDILNELISIELKDLDRRSLTQAMSASQKLFRLSSQVTNTVAKYQHLFQQSPIPMWTYSERNLNILNVNDAALRTYGYNRTEFLSLTIEDLRPKEDIPILREAIKHRKKGHAYYENSFRHIKKNGELIYVDIKSDDIEVGGEKARLILAIDITERVQAELALEQSEKRFKAIAQHGADLSAILTVEGVLQYIAPTTEGQLGYKTETLLNKNLFSFLHEEDVEAYKKRFELVLQGSKRIQMPLARVKNTKGEWRWISSRITNLSNNPNIKGLVINGRDVTGDFENQIKTQESIERYENVAKVTNDVIYTYNIKHDVSTIAGSIGKTIFGQRLPSTILNKHFWKSKIHPEDYNRVVKEISAILSDAQNQKGSVEFRFLKNDGSHIDILNNFFIVYENGQPVELQGVMRDISLPKFHKALITFEKELYQLNAQPDISTQEILEQTAKKIEALIPSSSCSIIELSEGKFLKHLAAPSLPSAYWAKLNGLPIGPKAGSCGTAMYFGKNVIVDDMDSSPLWEDYSVFTQQFGLKSCWSIPIKLRNGVVIGSFATYHSTTRRPSKNELALIERAANVLGSLMEGWKALEETKKWNERYDLAAQATKDIIWDFDVKSDQTTYSEGVHSILGYDNNKRIFQSTWWPERVHPEDRAEAEAAFTNLRAAGNNISVSYRFKCANGQYKFIEDKAFVLRDETGAAVRLIGAMHDATDQVNSTKEIERQNTKLKEITWKQSHEVRAPLSRILGLIELLEMGAIDNTDETTILQYIKDSAQEMDVVIREIVAKIDEENINVPNIK